MATLCQCSLVYLALSYSLITVDAIKDGTLPFATSLFVINPFPPLIYHCHGSLLFLLTTTRFSFLSVISLRCHRHLCQWCRSLSNVVAVYFIIWHMQSCLHFSCSFLVFFFLLAMNDKNCCSSLLGSTSFRPLVVEPLLLGVCS